MSMTAEILAIGKFSQDVRDHLEYPPELYADTQPGRLVFGVLFQCNGVRLSGELAEIFGTQPLDFNTHLLDLSCLTPERRACLANWQDGEDLASMDALAAAGFKFVFRPNM